MTYMEKLKKAFPDAEELAILGNCCPGNLFGDGAPKASESECRQNTDCRCCWDKEVDKDAELV